MNHRFLLALLLMTTLLLVPMDITQAQTSLPRFRALTVALWPEYDRPDVLVIYRGQLSIDTELPARLTFRLPGHIENMHAVAIRQDGALLNVDPNAIERTFEGDDTLLTFPASSSEIQFEYYDPVILTKQGQTRQITYTFSALQAIETTVFEVQYPFQAEDLALVPEPSDTYTGDDGLMYSTVTVPNLTPDDTFELSLTYRRNTSELSAERFKSESSDQPVDIPGLTEESSSTSEGNPLYYIIYAFGGAAVALLLNWWVRGIVQRPISAPQRSDRDQRTRRRKRRRKDNAKRETGRRERVPAPVTGSAAGTEQIALFCYHCGVALREDANFCHECGAERRGVDV